MNMQTPPLAAAKYGATEGDCRHEAMQVEAYMLNQGLDLERAKAEAITRMRPHMASMHPVSGATLQIDQWKTVDPTVIQTRQAQRLLNGAGECLQLVRPLLGSNP